MNSKTYPSSFPNSLTTDARKKAEEEAEAKIAAEQTEDDEAAKLRSLLQLFALRV